MKIVHIASHRTGGAGIASIRIHNKLLLNGFNSKLFFLEDFIQDNYFFKLLDRLKSFIIRYLFNNFNFISNEFLFLNFLENKEKGLNSKFVNQIDSADVVFVHWISNHLNSFDLFNLYSKTNARIIYIMMDMAHVTGGCHYPRDCSNYIQGCFNCPALGYNDRVLAFKQQLTKSINISKFKGEILAFSDSDLNAAINSSIPFYKYWRLNIPFENIKLKASVNNRFIILPSAYSFLNNRKGINYFKQVLYILENKLDPSDSIFVYNIDYPESFKTYFSNIKFVNFKYSTDINSLKELYETSSVLCFTSVSDSAPQLIIEALLSNTRVFSFDVGYVREVLDSINGDIIFNNNVHEMADKIFLYYRECRNKNYFKNPKLCESVLSFTNNDIFKSQFELILNGK